MPIRYFEWFIQGRSCLRPFNLVCVFRSRQSNPTSTTHTPSCEACHPIVGRVFPLIRMLCKPTRCSHDVVHAMERHLRLDKMRHRDAFPISHNFYRLRYIMVSIRAHPSTQKNCITEDSRVLHSDLHLRTLRSDRAGIRQHRLIYSTNTDDVYIFYPGIRGKILLRTNLRTRRPVHYDASPNLQAASAAQYSFLNDQLLMKTLCTPLQQRRS